MFTIMNLVLPEKAQLSMHCSANVGERGDTAILFGLSGTRKTTLSADPDRELIGDDEHVWTDAGVSNFEATAATPSSSISTRTPNPSSPPPCR